MKPLYIFDMDGTLSLLEHRRHLLENKSDPKRWDKFYAKCEDDDPNIPIILIANSILAANGDIYIFTGRPERCREMTQRWLMHHAPFLGSHIKENKHRLVMRPDTNYMKDCLLKESWYYNMLTQDKDRLIAIFDDRQSVVNTWRRNNITCLQVAEGNF